MSVAKMKDGKRWYVFVRYKDWDGVVKQHKKEGFERKADAKEYEKSFLEQKNRGFRYECQIPVCFVYGGLQNSLKTHHICKQRVSF